VKAVIADALFQCMAPPCVYVGVGQKGHLLAPGNWV